jgi:hypothetical protein
LNRHNHLNRRSPDVAKNDIREGLAPGCAERPAGCSESENFRVPELPPHVLICGLERNKSFLVVSLRGL